MVTIRHLDFKLNVLYSDHPLPPSYIHLDDQMREVGKGLNIVAKKYREVLNERQWIQRRLGLCEQKLRRSV